MKLFDPLRLRLPNGRGCWVGQPGVAIPAITVEPTPDANGQLVDVEVIVNGGWVTRSALAIEQLPALVMHWHDDPEGAMVFWFGALPPATTPAPASNAARRGQGTEEIQSEGFEW